MKIRLISRAELQYTIGGYHVNYHEINWCQWWNVEMQHSGLIIQYVVHRPHRPLFFYCFIWEPRREPIYFTWFIQKSLNPDWIWFKYWYWLKTEISRMCVWWSWSADWNFRAMIPSWHRWFDDIVQNLNIHEYEYVPYYPAYHMGIQTVCVRSSPYGMKHIKYFSATGVTGNIFFRKSPKWYCLPKFGM